MRNAITEPAQYSWVLLALFAASLEPVLIKIGYQSALTPLQLLSYKSIFAAICILPLTRVREWIGWTNFWLICSVSPLLLVTNLLVLYALTTVSAIVVVTMMTTTPIFVAICNQYLGRDEPSIRFWLGLFCSFLGVLFAIDAFSQTSTHISLTGITLLLLAVMSSTIYRTRMEKVTKHIPTKVISTYLFLINGLITCVFLMPWIQPIQANDLWIASWIGIAAAVANFAFLSGIALFGATRMSVLDMLQRPLVIIAATVLLREVLDWKQYLGILCVFIGVHLAKVRRIKSSVPVETEPSLP